ncbi:MAG: excinuclease ABC subunit C [Planctomycetes bacterium GWF2_41_51]|nr:MAG: excinuclease ABC subunit C [Planctomycetes bacterium GWF2_41_51]
MYYVYVLLSEKDGDLYTGYTNDLKDRVNKHNNGDVQSTKHRTPLTLIYYESCLNQTDAIKREKKLKTTWGKRYLKSRLENYFKEFAESRRRLKPIYHSF